MERYKNFIELVTSEIERMFEYQKEYICCKEGCSLCCESGSYPFSRLEFEYIKSAFDKLPEEVKSVILSNVEEIAKEYKDETSLYRCPFLINGLCSVYQNRGIVCRTHGLITENAEKHLTVPYCAKEGLNYGKVYNPETKRIDEKTVRSMGYEVLPKGYNLSRKNIMSLNPALDFGEDKPLFEWMIQES